jgi:hypothetical protein
MRPGTNKQVRLLACRAQGLVVLELPVQEDIVPAAHKVHRRLHFRDARAKVDGLPVVVVRSVQHARLEMLRWLVNYHPVGLTER